MSAEDALRERKARIESEFGPWTAHNIALGDAVFTISPETTGDELKLRRIVQVVSDLCGGRLEGRRVLDLACLEGMYALEFARRGAAACAIEGREANLAKARFAARELELHNVEFHHDNVLNLDEARHGRFDVILCLGIQYHIDVPAVFGFLERIYEVCDHALVLDTHVALSAQRKVQYDGRSYWGKSFREHADDASPEAKESELWASLDNAHSFEFTRPSLYNLLAEVGFSTVYECQVPQEPDKPATRATFIALKGTRQEPVLAPQLRGQPPVRLREQPPESAPEPVPWGQRLRSLAPGPLKRFVRGLRGH